jgi:hypothetical protein
MRSEVAYLLTLRIIRVQLSADEWSKFEVFSLYCFFQRFVVTSDSLQQDRNKRDLSELRVDLLRSTVINLLKAVGYELADMGKCYTGESTVYLHLSTKSSSEIASGYQRVLCGVVINSKHHSKESTVTAQEYLRCVYCMLVLCPTTAAFQLVFSV